jgi:hypothetical protein
VCFSDISLFRIEFFSRCKVGYGDITPSGPTARMIASLLWVPGVAAFNAAVLEVFGSAICVAAHRRPSLHRVVGSITRAVHDLHFGQGSMHRRSPGAQEKIVVCMMPPDPSIPIAITGVVTELGRNWHWACACCRRPPLAARPARRIRRG